MKWTNVACLLLQAVCNDALQALPSDLEKMLIPLPLQVYLGNHSIGEVIETLEDGDVAKDETETVKDEVQQAQPKQKTDGKSKAIAPKNPSIEVDSPLLKSASEEVKAQVEHGVKKAVKEGLAEMEEAAKEAQQKWVSEATVVALEDQARLKKAIALDLDQVTSKVKAVQGVQQKVLQNMERQVQAAVQNITSDVLMSSAKVARNRSWELANKDGLCVFFFEVARWLEALGPSLAAISDGEATIETLRNDALEQEEEAASDASRLAIAAQKAQNYLRGLTQMPQAAAEELHKRVDLDLEEAKEAKVEAKSALDAMKEAKDDAEKTLSLANLTEAEAEEVLKNALAQAEEIKDLEKRAKQKAEGQTMLQLH